MEKTLVFEKNIKFRGDVSIEIGNAFLDQFDWTHDVLDSMDEFTKKLQMMKTVITNLTELNDKLTAQLELVKENVKKNQLLRDGEWARQLDDIKKEQLMRDAKFEEFKENVKRNQLILDAKIKSS